MVEYETDETVADFLDAVQARSPSWTWRVPQQQLARAIEVGRRWTVDRFGSVDVRLEEQARMRWWTFDVKPVVRRVGLGSDSNPSPRP